MIKSKYLIYTPSGTHKMKSLIIALLPLILVSCELPLDNKDNSNTVLFGDSNTKAVYGSMEVTGGIVGDFNFDYGTGKVFCYKGKDKGTLTVWLTERDDTHNVNFGIGIEAPIDTIGTVTFKSLPNVGRTNATFSNGNGSYICDSIGKTCTVSITDIDAKFITGTFELNMTCKENPGMMKNASKDYMDDVKLKGNFKVRRYINDVLQ